MHPLRVEDRECPSSLEAGGRGWAATLGASASQMFPGPVLQKDRVPGASAT